MSNSLWPHGCSPPGSSVHVNFQDRILEWVAISYSRGSFRSGDQMCPLISRLILYHWATWEDPCKRIFCSKSRKDRPMRNIILSGWQPPESFSLQPLSMMLPKGIWVTPPRALAYRVFPILEMRKKKKKRVTEQWRDPKSQRPYSENKHFFLVFSSPKFFSSLTHSVTLQNDFPRRGKLKTEPSNWKLIYFPFLSFQEIKTPGCAMLSLWNWQVITEYWIMAHFLIVSVLCELFHGH